MSAKLAATAGPPTPGQKILAGIILPGIFEISGQNLGLGPELMICIFRLKRIH